ncbi:unnamed protein product [Darwinula stevensoni]|uniref:C-type lectin n=1 Tax=Darwinula stevensoni TaxID=69355 RepID=A0A7R9A4H6_9CRUS|nr:unnamed protein product [Darwinula stevensoni]CAG0884296.1 unnamed protein product [Darwinula stevensoni]
MDGHFSNSQLGFIMFLWAIVGLFLGGALGQDCGGILTDWHGVVSSPGYPSHYPPDAVCTWKIRMPLSRKIVVTFTDFKLEETPDCLGGDYLAITDEEADDVHVHCGQNVPGMMESVGSTLLVRFESDADDEEGFGFQMTYVTTSRCEEGWLGHGDYCYYFSEVEMGFNEARDDCLAKGADLASVHSRDEQVFLQDHVRTGTMWIGAVTIGEGLVADPFNFDFLDGSAEDYQNVYKFEVHHTFENLGVGMIMAPDLWKNRNCMETRPVLCTSTENHGSDWLQIGLLYYHASDARLTFDDSRDYCVSFPNSDVLIIGDSEEKAKNASWFFESEDIHPLPKSSEYWIGLVRGEGGIWSWIDGSPVSLDRWEQGFPTSEGGGCGVMATSSWTDDDDTTHSYVCKAGPK